ncbi:TetR/AcrR family transcriptional regulator [Variovorax sp. J22R133]|uniref:TetR/AcrR family transcriptional regulator n=1 Tax=Variovorax brevis TaxID=3053503 RepID=UPI002578B4E5|nr:TetR/AcrR family transcriptional regulator [Variovorax sp. J22R133]MDM0112658.1 TetR/AcrR family transcriptional regulator [Variovorax sp. J22R133]
MTQKSPVSERVPARERLLAAAEALFYEEGFNTVGIDRVIERAGVAKASLYDCFGSKEELIRSYLAARHEARRARITKGLERFETPRERLLGMFDLLGEVIVDSNFRGCAFVKAGAESRPDSSVRGVCVDSRKWLRDLFADLAKDAGAADPQALGQQLVMLYDGATLSAQMDRNIDAAVQARSVAAALLDVAVAASATKPKKKL